MTLNDPNIGYRNAHLPRGRNLMENVSLDHQASMCVGQFQVRNGTHTQDVAKRSLGRVTFSKGKQNGIIGIIDESSSAMTVSRRIRRCWR